MDFISGLVFKDMVDSRRIFKSKLKWYQNWQEQIKCDTLSSYYSAKDFRSFWENINKWNASPGGPVSVCGVSDHVDIANNFKDFFTVRSSYVCIETRDGETVVGGK